MPSDFDRFQKLMAIFEGALALADAERSRFLNDQCAGDAGLLADANKMLEHAASKESPLDPAGGQGLQVLARDIERREQTNGHARSETMAGGMGGENAPSRMGGSGSRSPGSSFPSPGTMASGGQVAVLSGQYRIVSVLGEGGMGTVYEAEQMRPRRTVALKAIRPGLSSRAMLRRLEYEANVLARLHHPGIAQVYEAGASDPDHPDQAFFAMELVRGVPLTEYAADRSLTDRHILELIVRVCDAIQHAHQRGIIHRDLKPSNILVGDDGQPKILDFGVALSADANVTTMHTRAGQLVGTLAYMSPEQVGGNPNDVDARSDVYSIGVIMYRLLAGRMPHDLTDKSLPEAARIINEDSATPLGQVRSSLRGQIEMIVAQAMQKERDRRYQSAAALAEDIRRHLTGEAIAARRDSTFYVLKRLYRRNRVAFVLAAMAIPVLAAFAIFAGFQSKANQELANEAMSQTKRADRESARLRKALYAANVGFAQAALANNDVDRIRRLLEACAPDMRGWEWSYIDRLADRAEWVCPKTYPGTVSASGSPDGRTIYVAQNTSETTAIDLDTGTERWRVPTPTYGYRLSCSPDGEYIAHASGSGDLAVIRSSDGGEHWTRPFDHTEGKAAPATYAVSWSHGGDCVAMGGADGMLRLFDRLNGELLHAFQHRGEPIFSLCPGPFEGELVVGTEQGNIDIIDTNTGAARWSRKVGRTPLRMSITPDGRTIASHGVMGDLNFMASDGDAPPNTIKCGGESMTCLSISPDGAYAITGSFDRLMRRWENRAGVSSERFAIRGDSERPIFVAIAPDAKHFHTVASDGQIRRWRTDELPDNPILSTGIRQVTNAALSPDGNTLAAVGHTGGISINVGPRWRQITRMGGEFGDVYGVTFSKDGGTLYTGHGDGRVRGWNTEDWSMTDDFDCTSEQIFTVVLSPDGSSIAVTDAAGFVSIRDLKTGLPIAGFKAHEGTCYSAAFSPDGKHLATGGQDHMARIWSTETGKCLAELQGHTALVYSVAYSPSGIFIATASEDATVKIHGISLNHPTEEYTQRGVPIFDQPCFTCVGHRGAVLGVSFSPDSKRMVTAGADQTVRIWNASDGQEILTLSGHRRIVHKAYFSSDSAMIYSASDDGSVRLWDSRDTP